MIDRMKMSWPGVAIALGLCATCVALYSLGQSQAAAVLLAILAGQALPQPVKMHEGGE